MQVGTAESKPGELVTGWLDVTDLPTGTPERLPVLIAEGEEDGPTLWITASIHGNEVTALATAQDVMKEGLESKVRGTVVCLPNLNPAGLRQTTRTSYYHGDDPNRYFPDPDADGSRPPRVQELIDERIFEAFAESADALVDLHTAQVGSIPFVIRDRVLFGTERTEDEAHELADELERLVDAYDFPVINEYAAEEYVEQDLQRSTAGAALNNAGIPSFTVELGGFEVVEEDTREKGVVGLLNVMRELDMLPGDPEPTGLDTPVDFPVKRAVHPHTDTAGIVRHRVEPGDAFEESDVIADIVTPHGESKATVKTDHDGYVVGRYHGVAAYENDPVTSLAVRDDGDLVVPRSRE
ncbi:MULTISPECIES: succinylglutamate desuccinylase/aspartoacylase family protein [unclassified Haladaptatus]|uniref:succinylglutamate desuccinylase/aspartoacylase family protein n=1 Tax=unclassified Haladaptatus TaxID=2622732 RepID=UPI00209BC1D8|nr:MULTISPECIES: succinylglutamate desuccinylase/aspartoacylase family protein [unclassified Haladaptatus]MCO8243345.1 succinylglutamate desuccinylase/aspartoacylase family protein [Haladaptatus sp. AB643]MCO8253056.1 succinylglutamate desuccinylase/aspartoacylase family protein [Haladaptatus sp. AB618]